MYFLKLYIFFGIIYSVYGRNSAKALTDSLGQEIIEIGTPIKELPQGLEEEPAPEQENDSVEEDKTTVHIPAATKKDARKSTKHKAKPDASNQLNQEDDESRIEKELSEIYKDTDYKNDLKESDDSEVGIIKGEGESLRQKPKTNFKFYPDSTNKAEVERFRTSVDEISCDKGVTQRLASDVEINAAYQHSFDCITFGLAILSFLLC